MDGDHRSTAMSTWSLAGLVLTMVLAYTGSRVYELPKSGRPERAGENRGDTTEDKVLYTHLWNDPLSTEVLEFNPNDETLFLDRVKVTLPEKEASLKVLFVLLNDKPHPEDIEERRRFRFGIHTALAQERYKPVDAESLHLGKAPIVHLNPLIPFEWAQSYREEDLASSGEAKKLLLIAYINERQFLDGPLQGAEAPPTGLTCSKDQEFSGIKAWIGECKLRRLCALRYMIDKTLPDNVRVDAAVHILGPTTSSRLRDSWRAQAFSPHPSLVMTGNMGRRFTPFLLAPPCRSRRCAKTSQQQQERP
ncbi:MAG: hypothetical protein HC888_06395 [Candidatus Competibacteraceae bacterium]|nr:hypothetical protein [Candidatus Competibacteraceae bacterium]